MAILRILKSVLCMKQYHQPRNVPKRNIQVSVIGAASEIGSNVSLLLKQNCKIRHLKLYDDDDKVKGTAMELCHTPCGPTVSAFAGLCELGAAVRSSDIVVMTSRSPRKLGYTREQMIAANAPAVKYLCRALVDQNPYAFVAISTNPINSIIPFASSLLRKYNCYNPSKILGITHIDTVRSRTFAANAFQVNPRELQVPVIGGHSDDTIIPLFSNLTPSYLSVDPYQADTLTRLVRKAGSEVICQKQGTGSAISAMAWSINEFVEGLINALCGSEVILNCYTNNAHYGTRYFSGPTRVGFNGVIQTCCDLTVNDYESYLLHCAKPAINRDVTIGESYLCYIESLGLGN